MFWSRFHGSQILNADSTEPNSQIFCQERNLLFALCAYLHCLVLCRIIYKRVILLFLKSNSYYYFHYSCVIRGYPFYITILLPTVAILLVNVVLLIHAMRGLTKIRKQVKASKTESKDIFGQARIAFGCSILLGLTWLFAILAFGKLTDTFQWLFCIFNSFQGFFIFVFHTARNNDVKTEWKRILGIKSPTEISSSKFSNTVEFKNKIRKKRSNKSKNF